MGASFERVLGQLQDKLQARPWALGWPLGEESQFHGWVDFVGRQIVGVINFPPKQIGPFVSEFLLTGFPTENGVVITTLERPVPNGTRMA